MFTYYKSYISYFVLSSVEEVMGKRIFVTAGERGKKSEREKVRETGIDSFKELLCLSMAFNKFIGLQSLEAFALREKMNI